MTLKAISHPILADAVERTRKTLFGVAAISLFINLLVLATPIYMLQIFERVLKSQNVDTLVMLTLICGGALLAMAVLEGLRGLIFSRLGIWIDRRLGGEALAGSVTTALSYARDPSVQVLRDLGVVRGFLTGPSIIPLMDAPWVPLFLGVMFLLHFWLGVLATIGAITLFAVAYLNDRATRDLQAKATGAAVAAFQQAEAAVRNAELIRAMGLQGNILAKWQIATMETNAAQLQAGSRATMFTATSKFIRLGLQMAVLGVGAFLVMLGEFSAGAMIAGSIIMSRALAPVEQSIGSWRSFLSARESYGRLKSLFERLPVRPEAMPLPAPQGYLAVDDVTFALQGQTTAILRGISFELEPGQCLAVMGPSASGKTTLARLLVGALAPRVGAIRLDGISVSDADPLQLGPHVGYLPQNVELFNGTIAQNIARMGTPDADAVVAAAKVAGVHELILRLDNGYDTEIGGAGMVLSGGQRQRIALARAVYGNPRLLVLDEPNANLDQEGERALLHALQAMKAAGACVVAVSHRPSILRVADQVMIVEGGVIKALGPSVEVRDAITQAQKVAIEERAAEQPQIESGGNAQRIQVNVKSGGAKTDAAVGETNNDS